MYALRKERESIERMSRRNEKANLRLALERWKTNFAPFDQEGEKTQDRWFLAACHKHGEGVAAILIEAGMEPQSWLPVSRALERGFDALAFSMAAHIEVLDPLGGGGKKERHVLVEAALRGRVDAMEVLFGKAEKPHRYTDKPINTKPDLAKRANMVLLDLARIDARAVKVDLCETVGFLVGKGGSLTYNNREAFSITERMPLAWLAAWSGNITMLRALHHHGVHMTGKLPAQDRMAHPFPTTMSAALNGICEIYRQKRKIVDDQWQTLEFLAECGVADPGEGIFKRLKYTINQEDQRRVERLLEIAQANKDQKAIACATAPASHPGARPRF